MKKDTNFGQLVRAEAKRLYGDGFEFDKCTIEVYSWEDNKEDSPISYVVTFERTIEEKHAE